MSLFIPITKVDVAKKLVYGTLTEEIPDKTGEIIDYETAKPAFIDWSEQFNKASGGKSLGNVRAMHGSVAAGKFTNISFDDKNKRIQGVAKIIDADEWQKVLEGVYTGFSIGGGYAKRWQDEANPSLTRYTPVLSEISLVDNPAVPTATFDVIKQDGSIECRKFSFLEKDNNVAVNTTDTQDADENDADKVEALIEGLNWLEQDVIAENPLDIILPHIKAVKQFLAGEEVKPTAANTQTNDGQISDEEANKFAKFSDSMHAAIEVLQKRITQLETQPMPAKGNLRAISKSDDRGTHEEIFKKEEAITSVHDLMKIALSKPVEM